MPEIKNGGLDNHPIESSPVCRLWWRIICGGGPPQIKHLHREKNGNGWLSSWWWSIWRDWFFYTCQQSNGKMTDNILTTYVEIQSRQPPIRSLDDDNPPMPLFCHDGGPCSLPDLHHRFFFTVAESIMKAHKADCWMPKLRFHHHIKSTGEIAINVFCWIRWDNNATSFWFLAQK